jgi:hypothetical protein
VDYQLSKNGDVAYLGEDIYATIGNGYVTVVHHCDDTIDSQIHFDKHSLAALLNFPADKLYLLPADISTKREGQ